MYTSSLLLYLLVFGTTSIFCYDIGDFCTPKTSNESGSCVLLENCQSAIKDLVKGKYPQLCGFQGPAPIVCCVEIKKQVKRNDTEASIKIEPAKDTKVLSKSEQKCREYGKYIEKVQAIPLIPNEHVTEISVCKIYSIPLIIGGDSDPSRYPHMALIGYQADSEIEWLCSGSLISEKFVVTAAHCLNSRSHGQAKYIRLGDASKRSGVTRDVFQEFLVLRSFAHPEFKVPSRYHNIGLLEMNRKASFNINIRPICLPLDTLTAMEKKVDSTSWSQDFVFGQGRVDIHLLHDVENYVEVETCNKSYYHANRKQLARGILNDKQICTQTRAFSKDTCDIGRTAGGPLQVINKDVHCTYTLIGISSFGAECGSTTPRVYTRVSSYVKWIEDIVFN